MCSNCIVALHQRDRFEVPGITVRRPSRLPLWELEFTIGPDKLGPLIARYRSLSSGLEPYRPSGRSPDKKWYFVRRTNILIKSTRFLLFNFSFFYFINVESILSILQLCQ